MPSNSSTPREPVRRIAIVGTGVIVEKAMHAAQKLSERPLGALIASKRLLKRTRRERLAEAFRSEVEEFAVRVRSPEAKEAFDAFFHKRQPDFTKVKATP